ncbi:MAG TPA: FAD-binding oxidoreductase [Phycicoccus sp.]|nr:FAD-binding oxidoreductase [Phycicoccus sp.]HQK31934.1 FAD-binding oxidoreductase [Phycicoccus sp.]
MIVIQRKSLMGWGRTSPTVAKVVKASSDEELAEQVRSAGPRGVLARGLGRSYGDAAQNAGGVVLDLTGRDQVLAIDKASGVFTVEAGVSLDSLMRQFIPQGWFVPVTPGTRAVTVGGAIGSDIHGKNHHVKGTFGQHVRSLDLLTGTGEIRTLTPEDELFWATVGGMGLTGVVLRADVAMTPIESAFCSVDTRRCANLADLLVEMADDDAYEYSVAWVDCLARGESLGRSVLTRGRFARPDELPEKKQGHALDFNPRVPLTAPRGIPGGLLNKYSVAAFNEAWFRKAPAHRDGELQSVTTFFHPLDAVADWNRIYGPGGLLQYQVVVPDGAEDTIAACIDAFSNAGAASFLAVLKRFGPQNPGHLSFPTAGWTLALDVPATMSGLGELLDRLDRLVLDVGGKGYLAKDSRMSGETLRTMYPRLPRWQELRHEVDPDGVFQSDLARRLTL